MTCENKCKDCKCKPPCGCADYDEDLQAEYDHSPTAEEQIKFLSTQETN